MTVSKLCFALLLLLTVLFCVMQSHFMFGAAAVLTFTFFFSSLALIPLAILLDGYYGAFFAVPTVSLLAIVWYVISEVVRARMSVVQSEYE